MSKYFEDLTTGDEFLSTGRTVTEADVVTFAGLSGDFNPIHVDAESAAAGLYGQRVAHGILGLAFVTGLLDRMGVFGTTMVAMLGIDEWAFRKPVFIGDTVRIKMTIRDLRLRKDKGNGIVAREIQLLNQRDEVVQEGRITVLIRSRTAVAAAPADRVGAPVR